MRLSSILPCWLRRLSRCDGKANGLVHHRPSRKCAPRRSFVSCVDVLEDRTLPSTFNVLNLAYSGAGSLRQAILDANANPGADAIEFAEGVQGTITLTSGQLSINSDLTINGPGANNL